MFYPNTNYHYVLREGVTGHDVAALQLNLDFVGENLTIDGQFGPKTKEGVKVYQQSDDLFVDGIAGAATQKKLASRLWVLPQQNHNTPRGLVKGLTELESGYYVGAVNWSVVGGVDCGWTQIRVLEKNYSEINFKNTFDGNYAFERLASQLRTMKDKFYARIVDHQRAWKLAALSHNWPWGAETLSLGRKLSEVPEDWVIAASGGRLKTPAEWANFYQALACTYISTWPA